MYFNHKKMLSCDGAVTRYDFPSDWFFPLDVLSTKIVSFEHKGQMSKVSSNLSYFYPTVWQGSYCENGKTTLNSFQSQMKCRNVLALVKSTPLCHRSWIVWKLDRKSHCVTAQKYSNLCQYQSRSWIRTGTYIWWG
jgi:hypothetical protein